MRKIYFAGSIRGGREDVPLYREIIDLLRRYGEVLTEHVGDSNLSAMGEMDVDDSTVYKRDIEWLRSADCLVAEVTRPSTGVGYELAFAKELGKPILCIHRPLEERRLSPMVNGDPYFTKKQYSLLEELPPIFDEFLGRG
ncbi:hypothetical protein C4587_02655 [Candidatus Parcubacteria bacterium]|nr:MAG: hypothetical protein C4587_02655 [Candidatus Parcubacteria bacterium]